MFYLNNDITFIIRIKKKKKIHMQLKKGIKRKTRFITHLVIPNFLHIYVGFPTNQGMYSLDLTK